MLSSVFARSCRAARTAFEFVQFGFSLPSASVMPSARSSRSSTISAFVCIASATLGSTGVRGGVVGGSASSAVNSSRSCLSGDCCVGAGSEGPGR